MNQRLKRLIQLLELKKDATNKAYMEVLRAKEQLDQNKMRHDQLIGYKGEYIAQIANIGPETTYVGAIRNRINFINHLDTAIVQLNNYIAQLGRLKSKAEMNYKQVKLAEEGVAKLIERVKSIDELKQQRIEQKESDEYAQKQWYSKNNDDQ